MTEISDLAVAVTNIKSPSGEVKFKSVIYKRPLFARGVISRVALSKNTCDYFQSEGYLISLVMKNDTPVKTSEDLYGHGILLKFHKRLLAPGNSQYISILSSSTSSRYVLAECIAEIELKEFDLNSYITTGVVIPVTKLSEIEEKEYKSMLLDKLDKVITKVGTSKSKIDEFFGIDTLDELNNSIYQFLQSYSGLSKNKSVEYFETIEIKKRVELLLERLNDFYFNYVPEDKKIVVQTVDSYEDLEKYQSLINRIKSLEEETKEELRRRLKYMQKLRSDSSERSSIGEYFETLYQIPWDVYTQPESDLKKMREDFDNNQFGMKDAKERLLEYLAANLSRGEEIGGKVICLMGSPGTGKTLFAQNVARILNRKFTSIALGGIDDVTILRGQRKGWIGAEPGQIVKALIRAKTMNPVIILDEIDKIGGHRGDQVKAALLEIFDTNQNKEFRDAYLDIPIDISRILFVASGNYFSGLPLPLRDRMEIIQIPAYTTQDKIEISKKFTIPQLFTEKNIKPDQLQISDEAINRVVYSFRFDAGMRRIKQTYNKILNKYLLNKYEGVSGPIQNNLTVITPDILSEYVKLRNFADEIFDPKSSIIGEINMLWTTPDDTGATVGGGRSPIQVSFIEGKGDTVMTGSLADVTKEAVVVSFNYVKTKTAVLNIEHDFFDKHNLLIHFPSLSGVKDGPSCCTAIVLGMISALKGLPVPQSYGITGEMDLMGNVLPIGGVKTKVVSGLQAGLNTFLIPQTNKSDFENDLDEEIKKQVEVHFYSHVSQAVKIFFPDFECKL